MGGQEYLNESYMDLADRYRLSGLYHNAIATLSQIDTAVIASSRQEARYYNIFFETYYGLARTVKDSVLIRDYKSRENAYLLYQLTNTIPQRQIELGYQQIEKKERCALSDAME